MAVKWISTKHPGVRYYEHPTRKHGVGRDRYFAIRYQRNGKRKEEGLGWASEKWNAEKAANELAELKKSFTLGTGPVRLAEKREREKQRREKEKAEQARAERDSTTFKQYFEASYRPVSKTQKKPETHDKEESHFRHWICPAIGNKQLRLITPLDIERLKKKLLDEGKAPRTVQYVLATIRQIWNMARRDGRVSGESPTRSVKIPKFDNRRQRFLGHEEAEKLTALLKDRDEKTYRITLLSLHTGMRASEVFHLTWGCVDINRGLITILDPKSMKTRNAFMTDSLKKMFAAMERGKPDDLVFPHKMGGAYGEISLIFRQSVKDLGFNKGVGDPRQRVCFHTLRHTFGSWHAESGTDLYVIKELLGHGSITLTERYSHLSNGTLQNATRNFEKAVKGRRKTFGKIAEVKGGE